MKKPKPQNPASMSTNPSFLTGTTKELSTGASTAAVIEGLLHGWHGVLIILVVGGGVISIIVHHVEAIRAKRTNVRGVRNYGIIRVL